ncbi:MAG: hypothetical protein IJW50_04915 [Clostridia bacterium]|nr:hypothetical protein [Clostridia bacterium]
MKKAVFCSRARLFSSLLILLTLVLVIGVSAEETNLEALPQEYLDFLESLPQELLELLPDTLFSTDKDEVGSGVEELSDFSYLLRTLLSLVGLRLGECAGLLASVCGILLISAVCKALQSNLRTESIARAFSFCTTAAIIVLLFSKGFSSMQATADYFQALNRFTSASIPLMGGLYAIGGNVSSAVATSAGLTVFLTVLEEIVGRTVIPFCGICLALCMVNAMDASVRVGTLLGSIKKNYTTALSFLMMLLLAMLGSQSILGAAKDTLAMRSAKFAAGSMIPVVGGSVAELIKTVSASVGYLRGTVGICGVLLLLLLLFPTLVELLLVRMTWQLSASLADLLGCDGEKKLLEEFASINGYLIAAVAICSSVLFFAFTIFMHCASAVA